MIENLIVTITGPSCAGKSTLEEMMRERLGFERVISTTTRPMRDGDVDGVNYHFMSKSEFKRQVAQGGFVENVEFGNNYYGVSVKEVKRVLAAGKPIVIVCEPVGQKQIAAYAAAHDLRLYSIFVCNPASVISDRFIRRLNEEFDVEDTAERNEKIVSMYATRLAEMLTTEQRWIAEAAIHDGTYDCLVWEFDESNTQLVLDTIKKNTTEKETA